MIQYLFGFLLGCLILANAQAGTREEVLSLIPSDLASLSKRTSEDELRKAFASKLINKQDEDALYLHYFSSKNDVTIGLKDKHYDYLLMDTNDSLREKTKGLFNRLYSGLNSSQKDQMKKEFNSASHEGGRTLSMSLPEEGLTLVFYNDEAKTLKSIIMRAKP